MAGEAGNILILDDDPGILALERRALQRSGYTVVGLSSPDEALQHVRQGKVDLAVLDYQLQGQRTGLEFYQSIRSLGYELPAILVTGYSDERRAIEALRAGIRDVITKVEGYLDHLPLSVDRVMKQVRTERELSEARALRLSEERLRLALEAGRMGTWEWDVSSGEIVWSDLHYELMGYPLHGVKPSYEAWATRVHPDDLPRVEPQIQKCIRGQGDYAAVFRVVWPDDSIHWLDAHGKCRADSSGTQIRMYGVMVDISENKQWEQQLEQARQRAEEASRAKDQFLAILSHELRTPLTPVLTAVQMLESEAGLSDDGRESVQLVRRNVELEARLIDDMLDLTRIARGKVELQLQPVDAHETLRHVLAICDTDFRTKQIDVRSAFAATRPLVTADPTRLQQVFWNLLKNAAKFTPNGGLVQVETRDAGAGLSVTIRDNGAGIEPHVLARIFEPFEQGGRDVTRLFGGLGLGLSITKGLVDQHGGVLTAASDGKGLGATFTLTLPLASAPAVQHKPGDTNSAGGESCDRPLNILLVEDHEDTRKVMSRLLRRLGHDVSTAESVATATKIANATPFDLLISDIGLPDGSGLDLMRQIIDRRPIKGIVMSGFGMDEDIRRSREAGFSEHLTKPVSMDRLEAAIAQLCKRS